MIDEYILPERLFYGIVVRVLTRGAIAQLARAPALQAGGPGFESLLLHHIVFKYGVNLAKVRITPPELLTIKIVCSLGD